MEKMDIKDTQYIIGLPFDKETPHVHIAFNRIDNNGKPFSITTIDSEARRFVESCILVEQLSKLKADSIKTQEIVQIHLSKETQAKIKEHQLFCFGGTI